MSRQNNILMINLKCFYHSQIIIMFTTARKKQSKLIYQQKKDHQSRSIELTHTN